jgi:hypothetical protein
MIGEWRCDLLLPYTISGASGKWLQCSLLIVGETVVAQPALGVVFFGVFEVVVGRVHCQVRGRDVRLMNDMLAIDA